MALQWEEVSESVPGTILIKLLWRRRAVTSCLRRFPGSPLHFSAPPSDTWSFRPVTCISEDGGLFPFGECKERGHAFRDLKKIQRRHFLFLDWLQDAAAQSLSLKCLSSQRPNVMLLLSHFSHVRPCVTPETAAHQAPHMDVLPSKNLLISWWTSGLFIPSGYCE